jgi:hypothetical protein
VADAEPRVRTCALLIDPPDRAPINFVIAKADL